jgi:S1-C subfamily serine protease
MEEKELKELHEKILYPVVRVRTSQAGGSGTIFYSQEDPKNPDEWISFIITNWHVIEGAIHYKEEWNGLSEKEIKKEVFDKVDIDIFDYVRLSEIVSSNTHQATIIAHNESYDLAVLKLDTPRKMSYVAELIPAKEISKIKVFMSIYSVGCSLLHEPFPNKGQISSLKEIIDGEKYWMSNANSIFGNSGGAVFLEETKQFIGIPSRITSTQLGFGTNIVSWMGFFVPPKRIYKFIRDQKLDFLVDSKHTYQEAMKNREAMRKAWLKASSDER